MADEYYQEYITNQIDQEAELLLTMTSNTQMDPDRTLNQAKAEFIKERLTIQLLNVELLEATQCLAMAIFDPDLHPDIQRHITDYVQQREIGQGEYGTAATGSFKHAKDFFILKTSNQIKGVKNLKHEAVIGLFATNHLRKLIPNFSYVYGFYDLAPYHLDATLIYENVSGSQQWGDYIKTCSGSEFISTYLQCLLALQVAYEQCNFTHYDAHDDNVMVRFEETPNLNIRYPLHGGDKYLNCNGVICTFIDYGMCHAKFMYNNVNYNVGHVINPTFARKHHMYPDKANPLFDGYKLLCFGLNALYKYQPDVYHQAKFMLNFFGHELHDHIIPRRDHEFYMYKGPIGDLTHLIHFCERSLREHSPLSDEPTGPVLDTTRHHTSYASIVKS